MIKYYIHSCTLALDSIIENIRSMPTLNPIHGTLPPFESNMLTSSSYLPPPDIDPIDTESGLDGSPNTGGMLTFISSVYLSKLLQK